MSESSHLMDQETDVSGALLTRRKTNDNSMLKVQGLCSWSSCARVSTRLPSRQGMFLLVNLSIDYACKIFQVSVLLFTT